MPRPLPDKLLWLYLALYALVSGWSASFFPSYSWPGGDEATYYTYAENPWTLQSELFEGFPPKEKISPYNLRAFLAPFSLIFAIFGFTVTGARLVLVVYAVLLLAVSYGLMRRLVEPWLALGFTILLSLAPIFVTQTHVVRPEVLFTLGLMAWLWLLLRRDEPLTPRAAAGLGFLAASLLWVHYNAVIFWPILGLILVLHEGRRLSARSLAAFVVGGAAFGLIFVALNLYPARDTIRQFGLMPVTFVSSNRMPILAGEMNRSTEKLGKLINQWIGGELPMEIFTAWFTLGLFAVALAGAIAGLWFERRKAFWLLGLFVVLTVLAQWLFVPNVRDDHFLYILPPLFALAAATVGRLPAQAREPVTILLLAICGAAYVWSDATTLQAWRKGQEANAPTEMTLAELVDMLGPRNEVTVLGPQEFHAATYGARFRTFHSLIQSKSLVETLRTMRPDVVLITKRMRELIPKFIMHPAVLSPEEAQKKVDQFFADGIYLRLETGQLGIDVAKLQRMIYEGLTAEGYQMVGRPLPWSADAVEIWVRGDQVERLRAQANAAAAEQATP